MSPSHMLAWYQEGFLPDDLPVCGITNALSTLPPTTFYKPLKDLFRMVKAGLIYEPVNAQTIAAGAPSPGWCHIPPTAVVADTPPPTLVPALEQLRQLALQMAGQADNPQPAPQDAQRLLPHTPQTNSYSHTTNSAPLPTTKFSPPSNTNLPTLNTTPLHPFTFDQQPSNPTKPSNIWAPPAASSKPPGSSFAAPPLLLPSSDDTHYLTSDQVKPRYSTAAQHGPFAPPQIPPSSSSSTQSHPSTVTPRNTTPAPIEDVPLPAPFANIKSCMQADSNSANSLKNPSLLSSQDSITQILSKLPEDLFAETPTGAKDTPRKELPLPPAAAPAAAKEQAPPHTRELQLQPQSQLPTGPAAAFSSHISMALQRPHPPAMPLSDPLPQVHRTSFPRQPLPQPRYLPPTHLPGPFTTHIPAPLPPHKHAPTPFAQQQDTFTHARSHPGRSSSFTSKSAAHSAAAPSKADDDLPEGFASAASREGSQQLLDFEYDGKGGKGGGRRPVLRLDSGMFKTAMEECQRACRDERTGRGKPAADAPAPGPGRPPQHHYDCPPSIMDELMAGSPYSMDGVPEFPPGLDIPLAAGSGRGAWHELDADAYTFQPQSQRVGNDSTTHQRGSRKQLPTLSLQRDSMAAAYSGGNARAAGGSRKQLPLLNVGPEDIAPAAYSSANPRASAGSRKQLPSLSAAEDAAAAAAYSSSNALRAARARPGRNNPGSPGSGGTHSTSELLQRGSKVPDPPGLILPHESRQARAGMSSSASGTDLASMRNAERSQAAQRQASSKSDSRLPTFHLSSSSGSLAQQPDSPDGVAVATVGTAKQRKGSNNNSSTAAGAAASASAKGSSSSSSGSHSAKLPKLAAGSGGGKKGSKGGAAAVAAAIAAAEKPKMSDAEALVAAKNAALAALSAAKPDTSSSKDGGNDSGGSARSLHGAACSPHKSAAAKEDVIASALKGLLARPDDAKSKLRIGQQRPLPQAAEA